MDKALADRSSFGPCQPYCERLYRISSVPVLGLLWNSPKDGLMGQAVSMHRIDTVVEPARKHIESSNLKYQVDCKVPKLPNEVPK